MHEIPKPGKNYPKARVYCLQGISSSNQHFLQDLHKLQRRNFRKANDKIGIG